MRFVSLRVDGWLGQQDRLAVRGHALVVQRVEVASISRQVPLVGHQPNLTKLPQHITSCKQKRSNRDYCGHTANTQIGISFGCTHTSRASLMSSKRFVCFTRPDHLITSHTRLTRQRKPTASEQADKNSAVKRYYSYS